MSGFRKRTFIGVCRRFWIYGFSYDRTKIYYGDCGQKSIDPVVFYKLCLVGYLENIISDRKLVEHCSMRLDILFFLGYDIDEPLPSHSTISRTRQLFPESFFEEVFTEVLRMCVEKGMVSGHTQVIDSALVKANASMDSLELTYYKEEYDRAIERLQTPRGRQLKGKRQSTVEPVFGSLIQFFGMRKINTIDIQQANKVMLMAGAAYNLKKYLKFTQKRAKSATQALASVFLRETIHFCPFKAIVSVAKFRFSLT